MTIGIGTYTFTWAIGVPGFEAPERPLTPLGLLEKAGELGVSVVQLCDNLPLHKLDRGQLEELSAAAREKGITLEAGTRGIEPGHLMQYLEICRILHAPLLRTMIPSDGLLKSIAPAVGSLKEVIGDFESAGVRIALENYEKIRSRDLAQIIEELGSESAGVCLDTVNSFGALESPREVMEILAPHTINLHVKDFRMTRAQHQMGFLITGSPAGSGMLDMEGLAERLGEKTARPEFSAILELWTPYKGSVEETIALEREWAQESINYLKGRKDL